MGRGHHQGLEGGEDQRDRVLHVDLREQTTMTYYIIVQSIILYYIILYYIILYYTILYYNM